MTLTLAQLATYVASQSWGSIEARYYGDRVGRLVPGHSSSAPVRLMTGGARRRPRSYQEITQHALDRGLLELKGVNGRYVPAAEVVQ